jgi:hypothetical protein
MSTARTRIDGAPRRGSGQSNDNGLSRRKLLLSGTTLAAASALGSVASVQSARAQAQPAASGERPNILVIFGDDIGLANISAYSHGLMGYQTPNIDRIAREGMMFIDYYTEQSCTAGRSTTSGRTSPRTPTGTGSLTTPTSMYGAQAGVARFLETFKEFPPSQRPATFTIDQAMEKLQQSIGPN